MRSYKVKRETNKQPSCKQQTMFLKANDFDLVFSFDPTV